MVFVKDTPLCFLWGTKLFFKYVRLTVNRKVTSTTTLTFQTKDRSDLSSERAPHRDKAASFRKQLSDRK
jgi:hypothetical protein